ncbi:MAG: hypothetical protein SWY16_01315 [Cyanobacteriota bacterium]|nr:hypothetical protein [Cyanobacteriota bacterium]
MSNQEGFSGGFLAGALIGGLVGGVLGAAFTSRRDREPDELKFGDDRLEMNGDREPQLYGEEGIEAARQVLEVKIAQLNTAIDEVRHQLHSVNGNASGTASDTPISEES